MIREQGDASSLCCTRWQTGLPALLPTIASELHAPVKVMDYHEHAIGQGANATAITYIEMHVGDGPTPSPVDPFT